jgi:hypothetical protein
MPPIGHHLGRAGRVWLFDKAAERDGRAALRDLCQFKIAIARFGMRGRDANVTNCPASAQGVPVATAARKASASGTT